jgi:hypothetical protein
MGYTRSNGETKMTFPKALKMLLKGKCKSVKNTSIGYHDQNLENFRYWFCEQRVEEFRKKAYTDCVFSKGWEVDKV